MLAQVAGTDSAPIGAAWPTPAVTTLPVSCAVPGAPTAGLTADASTGLIAGRPPLSNGFAPDMSWLIAICIGSIANWAGVESICSCDIGFISCCVIDWNNELISWSSSDG